MPSALVLPTTEPPLMPPPASTVAHEVGPVIAARLLVDLRRPAKLSHPDDQRRVEQTTLLQIVESVSTSRYQGCRRGA